MNRRDIKVRTNITYQENFCNKRTINPKLSNMIAMSSAVNQTSSKNRISSLSPTSKLVATQNKTSASNGTCMINSWHNLRIKLTEPIPCRWPSSASSFAPLHTWEKDKRREGTLICRARVKSYFPIF
jgi:hypothetical protein